MRLPLQVSCLFDDELVRVRLMGVKSCGKIFAARKKKGGGKKKKQRFAQAEAAVASRAIDHRPLDPSPSP